MEAIVSHLQTPRFSGDNFYAWRYRILAILESKNLEKFLVEEPPTAPDALAQFKRKDSETRSILSSSMLDSQVNLIINFKTSKQIWDYLILKYESDAKRRSIDARNSLSRISMGSTESYESYIYRGEKMLNDARSLGSEISEEEFSNALIKGIPYRYNAVALQLGIMISPTLEDIRRVFKLHCERHALPERQHDSNKALNVGMPKYQYDNKNFGGQKYRYENRDYRGQNERDRTKLICNFCNRRGHTKKFCWFNSGKNNQSTPEGDTKKSFPKSQNIKIAKEGQTQNVQNPIEKTFFVRGIKNTKIIKDDKNQDFKEPRERAFLIKGTKSKKTTNVSNNSVINDKNICSEKIELSNSADERGDIIEQKPELNVPKLTDDLFSVNKLTENGKKIIYDVNGSHAVDKNREICKIESVNTESKIEGILNIGETNWDTWHKRLNHMSAKDMILMKNNNVVHKFDAELPINLNINCDTCVRSKLPKQSFNIVTAPQTEGILDLFHANLEGPLNFKSVGGARYILTLIDDFSQKLFTLFLDTKLEVTDILEDFIEKIEKQTNRRVKTIQTYNGAEIISDKINKLCKKRGIKHLLSATLTPKEIEIANKRSRDLFKGTRDLLVEAQLGPELWGESINTWTYVRNRTPTEFETLKTPEEIFTGIKPSVTHLKVFGCQVCHRYSKRKSSGKLAGMSKLYIFTGYSRCTKKYRILDPDTLETSEIRNLEFKENKKGNILLGTQKYKGDYNLINFEEHQNVSTGHKIKIVEEGNPRSDKYTTYSIMNENNYFNTSHDESDVNIVRKFKICKSAQVENYSQHDFKNYDKKKNVIIQPKANKHMFSECNNVIHELVQTVFNVNTTIEIQMIGKIINENETTIKNLTETSLEIKLVSERIVTHMSHQIELYNFYLECTYVNSHNSASKYFQEFVLSTNNYVDKKLMKEIRKFLMCLCVCSPRSNEFFRYLNGTV